MATELFFSGSKTEFMEYYQYSLRFISNYRFFDTVSQFQETKIFNDFPYDWTVLNYHTSMSLC